MNNYSLIEIDNSITNRGFNHVYAHTEHSLYVIDGIWETDCTEDNLRKILREFSGELLIVTQEFPDSVQVGCISMTPRTKALEFLDYLFGNYGIIKGNANYAQGKMSTVLLKVSMKEKGIEKTVDYFLDKADGYFSDLQRIVATSFVRNNQEELEKLEKYTKKNIPWAFVRSLDIAPKGTRIRIKTLENDTGVEIFAGEKMIVMIGCLGEIYEITEEKFRKTYTETEECLDIFDRYFDFIPAVELPDTAEYITIDEMAHLCYPKSEPGILARPLDRRTKVFRKGSLDYFIGKEGDYIAVRCDDYDDVYIIQQEVFLRTYEKA